MITRKNTCFVLTLALTSYTIQFYRYIYKMYKIIDRINTATSTHWFHTLHIFKATWLTIFFNALYRKKCIFLSKQWLFATFCKKRILCKPDTFFLISFLYKQFFVIRENNSTDILLLKDKYCSLWFFLPVICAFCSLKLANVYVV